MTTPISIRINGKTVQVSQPYRPSLRSEEELVGRDREARMALAAWIGQPGFPPLAPLLVGEAGVGKNRLVYELARCTGKELYLFQGHEDVTAEDLACAVRFSDDPQRKMDYLLSPLATAMVRGAICFIDEIGKFRSRALAPLVSVLDERRYLDSNLLGERIAAQPGFRFVAATNTVDLAGNALPEFIRSRLRPQIQMGFPPREEIDRIVRSRFPRLNRPERGSDSLQNHFWRLWRKERGDVPPSPRDTLFLFGLTLNLADAEAGSAERRFPLEEGLPCATPTPLHLEAAFRQLFETKGKG
jgi:MoxR-like ATPase